MIRRNPYLPLTAALALALAAGADSSLFLAVVEAVEEAVYNSLTTATTVRGREGNLREAIPIEALRRLLADRRLSLDDERGVEETSPHR